MSSCTDKIYSHKGKELSTHLLNVAKMSKQIFEELYIENNNLYANISFLIGLAHDFAKSTTYFQNYLLYNERSEYRYHSFLSAIFGYYITKKYLEKNKIKNHEDLPLISYICIKNHHGNLNDIHNNSTLYSERYKIEKIENKETYIDKQIEDLNNKNIDDLKEFYKNYDISIDNFFEDFNNLKPEIRKKLKKFSRQNNIKNYLNILFFFSVLIDSDKFDASKTQKFKREKIESDLVDQYIRENLVQENIEINKIRNEAYSELNNNIEKINLNDKLFSITLPTGSGKTLSSFSFALKLREKIEKQYNFKPRIIYSLPFLSIIDQNEEVIKNVLKIKDPDVSPNLIIKSSSTAKIEKKYKTEENSIISLDINKAEMLIEGWYSEIIITTFHQLFYTIFSNKNRNLRKLHNIANSIIILDEVQALPIIYWDLLNIVLKEISEIFNVWFIFLTATQPTIFNKDEIKPLIQKKDKYFNYFNRINYNFDNTPKSLKEFKEYITKKIESENDKDIMIVLNTIDSSLQIYNYIKENISDTNTELFYLSTNIVPKQRLERINTIRNTNKRKIIVTTQLIEAGVDIDVDIIYRDFTVLDSIIQTAGRCNRNNKEVKGEVNIIKLKDKNNKQYSQYIYDKILLLITEELTEKYDKVSEKKFNKIIEQYYNKAKSKKTSDNSEELLKSIKELKLTSVNQFKLIEEDIEKVDIFIELDDEATKVWKKYIRIHENSELESYKKKIKFKQIRNQFVEYVISIDIKKLEQIEDTKKFYIPKSDLENWYDKQTGFIY